MHNSRRVVSVFLCVLFLLAAAPWAFRAAPGSDTLIIMNAQLADGMGSPLRQGSLRIRGDRIASIGNLVPAPGERTIDAHGLVLAPGFIDVHNHSVDGLDSNPLAE